MWSMFTWGMLMPSLRYPNDDPKDNRRIQVRVRRVKDLEYFREHYCPELGPTLTDKGTDYEARAYCTHEQLAAAYAKMAMDIDYQSFKAQSTKKHGDHQLHNLYYKMWQLIYDKISTRKAFSRSTWTKTTTTVEHFTPARSRTPRPSDTIEWGRMRDLSDAQLARLMRLNDDEEPDTWQLAEVEDEVIQESAAILENTFDWIVDGRESDPRLHGDHSVCDHPDTRSQRKACRKRTLRKYGK